MTLSPDGKHVAYTQHAKGVLRVVVLAVDQPEKRITLEVDEDRPVALSREKARADLRYLRWASPTQLVIAPTEYVVAVPAIHSDAPPAARRNISSPVMAFDLETGKSRTLIDNEAFNVEIDLTPDAELEDKRFAILTRNTDVFGVPGDRAHVFVEAMGLPSPGRRLEAFPTELVKIDVATGKYERTVVDQTQGKLLYDWQGRERILLSRPEHNPNWRFLHLGLAKNARWSAMDEKWSPAAPTGFTLSPANYFGERAVPLGFGFEPRTFFYASNLGRDTFGVYALDVETRQRLPLAIEHPHLDLVPLEPAFPSPALVFDETRRTLAGVRTTGVSPVTVWVDREMQDLQLALERKLPRRTVEILEWDDARTRFLLRVTSGNEPGRYFVFQRTENLLVEFLRAAPWLKAGELHETQAFAFDSPAGVHLTGYLTLPRTPRLNPPPVILYFPAGFPARVPAEFDREAQILAGFGFIVVRVNHRGTAGFGARHRDAIQAGVDRVPIEDGLAALDWLATQRRFDTRRIALMGEGFGGYLALRGLQLHPGRFRCAVAVNAPLDLELWLRRPLDSFGPSEPLPLATNLETATAEMIFGPTQATKVDFQQEVQRAFFARNATSLKTASVLADAVRMTEPVFLIVDPHRAGNEEIATENGQLRSRLKHLGRPADFMEVKEDFALKLPAARAAAFQRIEEFFNLNLYDYKVKVGPSKEVK